ncbi:glutathione S-transferase family protein [Loktanella sp. TSTF-M6]|uniref:Glutathione S-transferase family protein n=1 Tax=Loktanella gaetbuli TaxID=2881335 RepID=A0ABS8BWA1_9RHOB|nr:glutathione S-transferase family protein [Loktanella gaetbuli]MCB5199731.1 glutathione S-transferase family protein [Loktanella gaetbuli]
MTHQPLRLHYAPDNASLCIRLACELLDIPYQTVLVDRASRAQDSAAYRALNPAGLIPVLETDDGPVFETAAILIWLANRYPGQLMPAPATTGEAAALSWLLWLANTLHPTLRMTFYPAQYMPDAPDDFRAAMQRRLSSHLHLLDRHATTLHPVHHCYLAPMLRWTSLYGDNAGWFTLTDYPRLHDLARQCEVSAHARRAAQAEGLGDTPFSAPRLANPPEGSAT